MGADVVVVVVVVAVVVVDLVTHLATTTAHIQALKRGTSRILYEHPHCRRGYE